MAALVYAARSLVQLERAVGDLGGDDPAAARAAASAIGSAFELLAAHPLLGRRIHGDIRELVISYGRTGYVALYRFVVPRDELRILAIRPQRALGFVP